MNAFFTRLASVLKSYELLDACGRSLIVMIGSVIESQLITMILKDVIAIAAPVTETADEDQQMFTDLLDIGEEFVSRMKELGFFSPKAKLIFELDKNTIFVDRRCFAIVSKANKLINETYDKLVTVGVEDSAPKDIDLLSKAYTHAEKYGKEYGNDLGRLWSHNEESQFPSFFAFQKCTVRYLFDAIFSKKLIVNFSVHQLSASLIFYVIM